MFICCVLGASKLKGADAKNSEQIVDCWQHGYMPQIGNAKRMQLRKCKLELTVVKKRQKMLSLK
jgi:hypothetical protein